MKKKISNKQFPKILFRWFEKNKRDLPWRKTRDPYKILVSEIMLQQTQVDRVLKKYPEFLKTFPNAKALAGAKKADVILAWQGMGYNRRILNMQKFVQSVFKDHGGTFPKEYEVLKKMPGMGPVTAASFLAFAYGKDIPALDTNIRRVIHRVFYGPEVPKEKVSTDAIFDLGKKLIPRGKGWDWNQAMMDFGSLVCQKRRPLCDGSTVLAIKPCPFQKECKAYPKILSIKPAKRKAKKEPQHEDFLYPNRIYRGRVIEYLRKTKYATVFEVGRAIEPLFKRSHLPWMKDILKGLLHDGLIQVFVKDHTIVVSLPR